MSHLHPKSSVLVLYAEPSLQTTLSLSSDLTVQQVIAKGQAEIETFIGQAHGIPQFKIDPECTDFFPAADQDVKIGDLPGLKTIVCWPKSADANDRTPSPLTDLLRNLKVGRSEAPAPAPSIDSSYSKDEVASILARLARLESTDSMQEELRRGVHARLTNLEREQTASLVKINFLEKQQKDLVSTITKLQSALTLSMSAVTGDDEAVAKVLFRVLSDRARAQLAKICGFDSWAQFESETADDNDIFNTATRHLRRGANLSPYWKALAAQTSALWALITPDPEMDCDLAGAVTEGLESNAISASIESLPEGPKREDLIALYRAIFNTEPDLNPQ
jgi:hypothetical protein